MLNAVFKKLVSVESVKYPFVCDGRHWEVAEGPPVWPQDQPHSGPTPPPGGVCRCHPQRSMNGNAVRMR